MLKLQADFNVPDYIRTFTWDKKLETILKSNFGGQGELIGK